MEAVLLYADFAVFDSLYIHVHHAINFHACSKFSEEIQTIRLVDTSNSRQYLCGLASSLSTWERSSVIRQLMSFFLLTWVLTTLFYLFFGTVYYFTAFDRSKKDPKRFRQSQIWSEIRDSLHTIFWCCLFMAPVMTAQVRGYSKIYAFASASWWYEIAQYPLFALFSDTWMYWMHRLFHHPILFRRFHSKHHRYVIPTPFSAYAFDPMEAWLMSLCIFFYSFLFPMSDVAQIVVFCATNVWSFLLHDDSEQFHTVHHKSIGLNFGQYTSLWDRLGGTYVDPASFFHRKASSNK